MYADGHMTKYSDEQLSVIRDLAAAGGAMVVSTDVMRGPVIALWLEGLVRSSAVEIGRLELHLTDKGWLVVKDLPLA